MRLTASGVAELSPHDHLTTERELAVCPARDIWPATRHSNAGAKAAQMRLHGLRPTRADIAKSAGDAGSAICRAFTGSAKRAQSSRCNLIAI
jgi:hypothetical protein